MIVKTFSPIYGDDARVLILGSAPSVRSLAMGQFYGHPQNRFWKVMFALFDEEFTADYECRKALIIRHKLALWDTIAVCEREGSMDGDIRGAVPGDIPGLIDRLGIRAVALNGLTARRVFEKARFGLKNDCDILSLPSTSPANARWNLNRLTEAYGVIKTYLA